MPSLATASQTPARSGISAPSASNSTAFATWAAVKSRTALAIAAALGFVVVYSLWTLQFWAFWLTAAYESMEIAYELFLLTQPEYRGLHILGPIFGIFLSAITLGYIFLDRSVKPVFRRVVAS